MEGFLVGIFVSCLFIQWNTGRINSNLDSILHEIRKIREDGDTSG